MSILTSQNKLTNDQWSFLEENFDVLDLVTRGVSKDFSPLLERKVVLIGELHGTTVLSHVQAQFFQMFASDGSHCLLIEGLTPGKVVPRGVVDQYKDYPEGLEIRGSDIRDDIDIDIYSNFINRNFAIIKAKKELRDIIRDRIREVASLINKLFCSHQIQLVERGLVTSQDQELQIRGVFGREQGLKESLDKLNGLKKRQRDFIKDYHLSSLGKGMSLSDSNKGLVGEIKKLSDQFEKVFAVWGGGHFRQDPDLLRDLESLEVIVLVPSEAQEKLVLNEVKGSKTATLKINEWELVFPGEHLSYFHPSIQKTVFV